MVAQQNVRGSAVDSDARRINDPVTVVVWPSGLEQDADDWSAANNCLSAGAAIKEGHPTGPEMVLNPDGVPAPGLEPDEPAEPPRSAPVAPRPAPTTSVTS